jgi:hypothetical protein
MPRRTRLGVRAIVLFLVISAGCGDDGETNAKGDASTGPGATTGTTSPTAGSTSSGAGSGGGGGGGAGGGGATWPDGEPFGGGDRLAVRMYDGGGDARYFVSFVDTELGAPCEFFPTVNDGLRCMPLGSQLVYADADCTEPLLLVFDCVAQPAYGAAIADIGACESGVTALYRGGGAVDVDTVYFDTGEACSPQEPAAPVVSAEVVDLRTLVSATIEDEPFDDVLGARVLRADDGSFYVTSFTDGDRLCSPSRVDGAMRCTDAYPAMTSATLFADETCEDDDIAFSFPSACSPPPAYAIAYATADDPCGTEPRAHELGGPLEAAYTNQNEACEEVVDDADFATLGAPLALPELEPIERGSGRLRATFWGREAGIVVPFGISFHDTELDVECFPLAAPGGTLRCVPTYNVTNGFYADEDCTEPLLVHVPPSPEPPGSGCVDSEPSRFFVRYDLEDVGCSYVGLDVWERGAPHDGDRFIDYGDGCELSQDEFGRAFEVANVVSIEASPIVEVVDE